MTASLHLLEIFTDPRCDTDYAPSTGRRFNDRLGSQVRERSGGTSSVLPGASSERTIKDTLETRCLRTPLF